MPIHSAIEFFRSRAMPDSSEQTTDPTSISGLAPGTPVEVKVGFYDYRWGGMDSSWLAGVVVESHPAVDNQWARYCGQEHYTVQVTYPSGNDVAPGDNPREFVLSDIRPPTGDID
jgi:hypothetical protein